MAPNSSARSKTSPRPPSDRKAVASLAMTVVVAATAIMAEAKPAAKTPGLKTAIASARPERNLPGAWRAA
eukprot:scaffold22821_cov80-Isochrysis_galbana.AAC.2